MVFGLKSTLILYQKLEPVLPYLALAILAPIPLCTNSVLKSSPGQAWFPPGRVCSGQNWYARSLGHSRPTHNISSCPLLTASKFAKSTKRNLQSKKEHQDLLKFTGFFRVSKMKLPLKTLHTGVCFPNFFSGFLPFIKKFLGGKMGDIFGKFFVQVDP